MLPKWIQYNDTGLGNKKPDEETVDIYVSERQIQSYCTSHGYVAAVLRGRVCSFYSGPAEGLFLQKKKELNASLFISLSDMENPQNEAKEKNEWVVVDEEIGKIEAQELSHEQDKQSQRYQEQIKAEKALSDGIWDTFQLQPQNPSYRSSVIIFQNERWFPLLGWTAPLLYPSWTDAITGKKVKPCTKIDPPPGTTWCGEWQIDSGCGDMDDGWAYSKDFYLANFTDSCTKVDVVRRRRWWRDHTKKPETIFEA
eukprot:TRINITY_DN7721_c0_g1_i1.p1 TRINITY_DN7721_c0_g1~~TRINITY_DN7721_c0_g1_i1.p1  ORF type:complete len:254 (+),score=49.83 TRINITY_DN7721_c0_g1_i1:58-819(+)